MEIKDEAIRALIADLLMIHEALGIKGSDVVDAKKIVEEIKKRDTPSEHAGLISKSLADEILDLFLEHYDFESTQAKDHMHDCITDVLDKNVD